MSFTSSTPDTTLPRSITVIAGARALSLIGDEIALVALLFRAKGELGHWGVAAVLIAGSAPLVLLAPWAGLIVDRLRARRLLIAVTLVQALLTVALGFATTGVLIPLIALLACATAVAAPGWQVLVPALVTDEQLPGAMGRLQAAYSVAGIAGPFLGGFLFATMGFRGALFIDAGSFALLAVVPMVLRRDREPRPRSADASSDHILSGVSYVIHSSLLRSLLILITLFVLALGVTNVVEIFFITSSLHAGARGYGLLGLCFGSGMLIAALLSERLSAKFPRSEMVFLVSCVLVSGFLFAFAQAGSLAQAAITLFLLGLANAILNVQASVLLVRTTEEVEHLRGRIFAAVTGVVSAAQILSIALGGVLLALWTPRAIIGAGAATSAVVVACTFLPVLRAARVGRPDIVAGGEIDVEGAPLHSDVEG